jgi:hypothetical protein
VLKSIFAVLGDEAGALVDSHAEYIAYARSCYANGPRKKDEREKLRKLTMQSCLFDGVRYADFMRKVIHAIAERPSAQLTRIEV